MPRRTPTRRHSNAAEQGSNRTTNRPSPLGNQTLPKNNFLCSLKTSSSPAVSLVLVNAKSQVHPKNFEIQVTLGKKQVIKVGRSPEQSDMVLKANVPTDLLTISRMHALIYKNSRNEWLLVDKGSRNGCFVNGLKTLQQKLSHGDTIVFGGGGGLKLGTYQSKFDSKFVYQFFNPDTAANENVNDDGKTPTSHPMKRRRKHDSQTDSSAAKMMRVSSISKEFSCPICLDLLVKTRTLRCGHSFCASCVETSLTEKRQCPTCKRHVLCEPSRSFAIDNVICQLLSQDPLAKQEWEERKQEYENRLEHQKITAEKLVRVVDAAKKTERKFLNISDTWTPAEKRVFKKGVALYRGLARVEYCKCANLTSALLDEKSVPELKQIAANLAVEVESSAHADTVSLRDRLKMFILYG